ncbi:MAG: hypothetical protein ACKOGD_09070, partial [Sphingomonadales bacterium]
MYIMGRTKTNEQSVDYIYDNKSWQLQQVVVGPWNPGFTNLQNLLIVIPGMRFHRSDSKAFQISLAGVITKNMSFPFPMASWFYKF